MVGFKSHHLVRHVAYLSRLVWTVHPAKTDCLKVMELVGSVDSRLAAVGRPVIGFRQAERLVVRARPGQAEAAAAQAAEPSPLTVLAMSLARLGVEAVPVVVQGPRVPVVKAVAARLLFSC
jgi:hypothetical protein